MIIYTFGLAFLGHPNVLQDSKSWPPIIAVQIDDKGRRHSRGLAQGKGLLNKMSPSTDLKRDGTKYGQDGPRWVK